MYYWFLQVRGWGMNACWGTLLYVSGRESWWIRPGLIEVYLLWFVEKCEVVYPADRCLTLFVFSRSHVGCKKKIRHISVLSSTLVCVPDELSVTTNEILTEYFDTEAVHCACRGLYISTWIKVIRRSCAPGHPGSALNRRGVQGSPGNYITTDLRYTSSLFGFRSEEANYLLFCGRNSTGLQRGVSVIVCEWVGPRELKCLFVI